MVNFLLPSCPGNPGCCPATCRGSHQRKGQHCQLQVHNTTLQTWPGTLQMLLVINSMGYIVCRKQISTCISLYLGWFFLPLVHSTDGGWSAYFCHCSGLGEWTWCWRARPNDWTAWTNCVSATAGGRWSSSGALNTSSNKINTLDVLICISLT